MIEKDYIINFISIACIGCIVIWLLIMAYLIGIKGKLNLVYSIDQVKIAQYDLNKRRKFSIFIACIYTITAIILSIGYYNIIDLLS